MKRSAEMLKYLAVAVTGGLVSLGAYSLVAPRQVLTFDAKQAAEGIDARYARYAPEGAVDFTSAAQITLPSVVHIKATQQVAANNMRNNEERDFFREFFGEEGGRYRGGPRAASGSGVIVSADGYIVTNNHVIAEADNIEVVLSDNRSYKATIIGTDPQTDLALLKIKESNLPALKLGNSDAVKVGEWVLAVGNPFSLTGTVTAGIVSAKGRALGILQDSLRIESFIQTDAAVNPGNSGGALVNTQGELVGINTAIAGSVSGTYAGYSFAIPSNLVKKVMDDLLNFGTVQRAVLGISIADVSPELVAREGLSTQQGVYVGATSDNSAAGAAGIKAGDVIVALDGQKVKNSSELQEIVARHRPGEKVKVTFLRGTSSQTVEVTLRSRAGETKVAAREVTGAARTLGAEFVSPKAELLKKLNLSAGVQVSRVLPGILRSAGIRDGFIITHVSDQPVKSAEDIERILDSRKKAGRSSALVEGRYPDGTEAVYGINF